MSATARNLAAVAVLGAVLAGANPPAKDVKFFPSRVELRGHFEIVIRMGPPNYGETPEADARVEVPVLLLPSPIRIEGTRFGGLGYGTRGCWDERSCGEPFNKQAWSDLQHDLDVNNAMWIHRSVSQQSPGLHTGIFGWAYTVAGSIPFAIGGAAQEAGVLPLK